VQCLSALDSVFGAVGFISFQNVVQCEGHSSHPKSVPLYCMYPNTIR